MVRVLDLSPRTLDQETVSSRYFMPAPYRLLEHPVYGLGRVLAKMNNNAFVVSPLKGGDPGPADAAKSQVCSSYWSCGGIP